MPFSKRPDRALFAGTLLVLAVTASAQPLQTGPPMVDSSGGQLSPKPVAAGSEDQAVRSARETALERLRRQPNGDRSLLGDIARDYRSFFTATQTYRILGVGLGTSLAVHRFDAPISTSRLNAELWPNRGLDRTFEGGELLGGALFQVGGAFATYGVGKATGQAGLSSSVEISSAYRC